MGYEMAQVTAEGSVLWPILAGLLIIITNGFFVCVEFALVTVRRGHIEGLAGAGNGRARRVARLLQDPDRAIAATQVGITVSSILLGIVAEEPLQHVLGPAFESAFAVVRIPAQWATLLATVLVLLLLSFFHMVLGEQTPKTVALRYPNESALATSRLMSIFSGFAAPLVWAVDHSTDLTLRLLRIGGQTASHGIHTVEELKEVVRESHDEGVLPFSDEGMLVRAIEFGGRYVREAMVPRPDIVGIEMSERLRDLLEIFRHSRHSRFPVYEQDLDNIIGVVAIKDVLMLMADDSSAVDRSLRDLELIHPVMSVPDSRRIGHLFDEMRGERMQMAIVLDEFGGTAGLVTLEELVEEVVGRVTDDWVDESPVFSLLEGNIFEIDAQSRVDEVNDALQLVLPESPDYETVAGFLLFLIRRIPRAGEVIHYHGLRFTIQEMSGLKIERVLVEKVAAAGENDSESGQ